MTGMSSYTPFLIGEGHSKTGLFSYLDSWIKPDDAFDEMTNAYVYRGSLYERQGMVLFPSTTGTGSLVYMDTIQADLGDGSTGAFGGTLTNIPIIGTVTITAQTALGKRSSTASFGPGTVSWSTGGASLAAGVGGGGIDFTTGIWTLTSSSAVNNLTPIMIQYTYVPNRLTTPVNNPIMGIDTFKNEVNNANTIVVTDTKRLNYYNAATPAFIPVQTFQQIIFKGDGVAATTPAVTTQWVNLAPFTLVAEVLNAAGTVIETSPDIPTSATQGTWTAGVWIAAMAADINYNTGVITVTLNAPLTTDFTIRLTATITTDYFTGDNTNFFNFVNWRPSDSFLSNLWMTNNKDYITLFTLFNGSVPLLSRPPLGVTVAHVASYTNDISTALDLQVFQEYMLLIRPKLTTQNGPEPQSIFWNRQFSPLNATNPVYTPYDFAQDISGHGGFRSAPTGDWMMNVEPLRDALVVSFTNSTFLWRYTGNAFDPFRFIQVNNSRSTNAPYGGVSYDQRTTSMGSKGLTYCDGNNVDRYDISVTDLWTDINQDHFEQCFAKKFDTLNQTWMLYPSMNTDETTSDSVMVYNFLEDTWAKFIPNMGALVQTPTQNNTLSCLGLGFTTKDLTWADFGVGGIYEGYTWADFPVAWNNWLEQALAPILLGGDQNGFVYELNVGPTDNAGPDQELPIKTSIWTKQYNPFVADGEKARFGYLDVYYQINASVQIRFNFYVNSIKGDPALSQILTLDSPSSDMETGWKRIYINLTGQFIQWEISTLLDGDVNPPVYNTAGTFKILGQILYAAPAGRLTPGTFT